MAAGGLITLSPAAQASPPDNDDIGNAQVLSSTLPVTATGTNVDAARQPGEPQHLGIAEGASVWYAWTAPSGEDAVPSVWASTTGSDFDTTVSVYTGSPASVSTLTLIDDDDDYGQAAGPSRAVFDPTAGTTYYIAVDGSASGDEVPTGTIRLKLTVPSATTGHITGTVTNSSSQPVMNVCVHVVDQDNDAIGPRAITEANGSYDIVAPAVSDNHLLFRACDDLSPNVAGEYYSSGGGSQTLAGASDIAVASGGTTTGISAQLALGTILSGTVTGPGPDPAEDVCVKATRLTDRSPSGDRITKTDEDGHYTIPGLDGGDYRLRFGGTDGLCFGGNQAVGVSYYTVGGPTNDISDADVLTAVEGTDLAGINAGLGANPGRIKGTVLSSGGSPIADICVRADDGSFFSSVVDTNANGKYTIPGVPAGAAYVVRFVDCHSTPAVYLTQYYNGKSTAAAADHVTVVSAQDTTGIDATLVREATIGGQITDAHGNPRDPACVDVHTAGDPAPLLTGLEADADGRWSTPVVPGDYNVHLYNCGSGGLAFEQRWYDGEQTQASATTVTVTDGQSLLTLDQMLPGTPDTDGRITGRVTDDTAGNNPLEGICVTAYGPGGSTGATTDEFGRYILGDLSANDYKVEFTQCDQDADYNVLPQYWDDKASYAAATNVTVTAGTTTSGVSPHMHPAGAISGVVTDQSTPPHPLKGICVTALTDPNDTSNPFAPKDFTAADGTYSIKGLPTNDYFVVFEDCTEEYAGQWYDDVPFTSPYDMSPAGDPLIVPVTEGATATLDNAELVRNGTITGTITNEAGDPLVGICAFATSRDPDFYQSWGGETDANGHYLIGGLQTTTAPENEYSIRFTDCLGENPEAYGEEYYDNKLEEPFSDLVAVVYGENTPNIDAVLQSEAPVNTTLPTVTGTTSVGATLTAHQGTWQHEPGAFDYQWQRCDAVGDGCVPVNDATERTYVPTAADLDHRFYVTVTARNSVGDVSADSALTDVINDAPPPNDDIAELEELAGGLPITVGGDTNVNATREPGEPAHLGFTDGASVWYSWTAPSGGAALDAVEIDLAGSGFDTTLSVYDGTPSPFSGLHLVAQNDESYGSGTSTVTFAPMPGATYYIAVDGYVGSGVVRTGTVQLRLSEPSGIAGTATDANGDPVRDICAAAVSTSGSGTSDVDQTAADGTYFINLPPDTYDVTFYDCAGEYASQWYDGVTDAEDATHVTVVNDQVKTNIDAELVRVTNFGSIAGTVTDEAGDPVPDICVTARLPDGSYAGNGTTDQDGTYLVRGLGDPDHPGDTVGYTIDFFDCSGFYGPEYYDNKLDPSDADLVVVHFDQKTSNINAVLQHEAPVNTTAPTVTGGTSVGDTLTAHHGLWDHEPSLFDYEWERCDATGANCLPINDADDPTYVTTADDTGFRFRVAVTATNSKGSTTVRSAASAVIEGPPHMSVRPSITGATAMGSTMTAATGTWTGSPTFTQQWARCDASGDPCTPIASATGTTYEIASADIGHTLRIIVTATNAFGSTTMRSFPTSKVGAPSMLVRPAISGATTAGSDVTSSNGSWTGSPTFSYQWTRCDASGDPCSPIAGATDITHQVTDSDAGSTLRIVVTATNPGGSTTMRSFPTAVVGAPAMVLRPAVSGTTAVGSTLSATDGNWTGSPTISLQWARCDLSGDPCSTIPGAVGSSYELAGADSGHTLRVVVTATNAGGHTTNRSFPTAAVGAPVMTVRPTVSGQSSIGSTLTGTDGTWDPTATGFTYQWIRCDASGDPCGNIPGATSATYDVTSADSGHTLRIVVTATNAAGSANARSFPTSILGLHAMTVRPTVTGGTTAGSTLSATTGTWTGSPGAYTYQWLRCATDGESCSPIADTDVATYQVGADDIGHRIRIVVTVTNSAGSTAVRSFPTLTVGAPAMLIRPTASGAMTLGSTLSASSGTWSGSPGIAYQWMRCDAAGDPCTAIAGAANAVYQLTAADAGRTIRINITATNLGGSTTMRSFPTAVMP